MYTWLPPAQSFQEQSRTAIHHRKYGSLGRIVSFIYSNQTTGLLKHVIAEGYYDELGVLSPFLQNMNQSKKSPHSPRSLSCLEAQVHAIESPLLRPQGYPAIFHSMLATELSYG